MRRASLTLLLLIVGLFGCPTTEGLDGIIGDQGGGGGEDIRSRPDVGGDPTPQADTGADTGVGDAGLTDRSDETPFSNQAPTALAVARIDTRIGDETAFDGTDSTDPDGTLVAYRWDFGDGATDEGAEVTHVYTLSGVYDASLTVEDDGGLTDSVTIEVRVSNQANMAPIAVIDLAEGPFGTDQEIDFSAAGSSDPDGSIVSYSWEFRDTDTDTTIAIGNGVDVVRSFALAGSYEARLEVLDNQGAQGSDLVTFTVTDAPSAQLSITPEPATVGETVTFDGSSSTGVDGATIVSYDWDFGDGSMGEGASLTHAYSLSGSYDVVLTVEDSNGLVGIAEKSLLVEDLGVVPTANAGADRVVLLGDSVSLAGMGTDTDGSIVGWHWDLGDGGSATTQNVFHTYSSAGTFTATLTVTDDDDLTAMDTVQIVVHRPPTAVINVLTGSPTSGVPVNFSGLGSSDPDGHALISYAWTFGDGGSTSGAEPSHTYVSAGTFTVGLTVTDELGATGSTNQMVTVVCVGDCGATGTWRVRPFDNEDGAEGICNEFITITVGPANCDMQQDGSSLTMDCGAGFVYSGTRTGDNFSVTMGLGVIPDPTGPCGDVYITETIAGSFLTPDFWDGTSDLYVDFELWDPFFCYDCLFDPFQKTGTRQ